MSERCRLITATLIVIGVVVLFSVLQCAAKRDAQLIQMQQELESTGQWQEIVEERAREMGAE